MIFDGDRRILSMILGLALGGANIPLSVSFSG
jgi:hypothetical protein